jgi:hypothetical protein
MALVFIDGFDHYASAEYAKKGWGVAGSPTIALSSSYSRRAGVGQGMRVSVSASALYSMNKSLPADDVYTFGFAYKCEFGGTRAPFIFRSSNGTSQITIVHTVTEFLDVYRGDYDGTYLGQFACPLSTWVFLEIRIVISDTVGVVQARINGVQVLNLTGQDTNVSGSNIAQLVIGCLASSTYAVQLDDLYISNGDSPDEFLGDLYIDTVWPDADGDVNDWTANTGNRYAAVDDPTDIDDETTYVSETTDEGKQLFSFGALSSELSGIKAVQEVITVRKDTSPSVNIRPLFRTSGDSDYEGGLVALGDAYVSAMKLWTANPDDSQDWEATDIDNGQFGMIFTYTTTTSA